jgi:hypothetical protein
MSRFGWCLDGHHETCRVAYTSDATGHVLRCSCLCHETAQEAPLPEGK